MGQMAALILEDTETGCASIQDFMNLCSAQSGKHLGSEVAGILIGLSKEIADLIGCP
jgi:hypothetical protein